MTVPIHICVLTSAHAVDDMRVNHKFAHAFRSAGFRVTWVGPGHATFDSKNYNRDGVEFRLGPPIRNWVDRLLAVQRIGSLAKQVPNVDVYYAPEPDSAQIAIALAKSRDAKVIFDVHEIYHGALLDRWLLGYRLRPIREYMRRRISRIASQCDLVVGVSDSVLAPYMTPNIPGVVVRSCAPSWFAKGEPADVCGSRRSSFVVMHGRSHIWRGTMRVLEAAAICVKQVTGLQIIMFKSFENTKDTESYTLMTRIQNLGVTEVVDIRPGIPIQAMPEILQTCDVGLIAYGRDLGVDSLPNRLFEYMAAGLAIVAPIYAREIAKIIETEQCGLLVDFEDPADIAKAIVHLRQNPQLCREMGRRAREAFFARHNWETEVCPVIDRIQAWKH